MSIYTQPLFSKQIKDRLGWLATFPEQNIVLASEMIDDIDGSYLFTIHWEYKKLVVTSLYGDDKCIVMRANDFREIKQLLALTDEELAILDQAEKGLEIPF